MVCRAAVRHRGRLQAVRRKLRRRRSLAPDPGGGAGHDPQSPSVSVVYLFDVDNTLLDNDAIVNDLRHHLQVQVGADIQARYWAIFEAQRQTLGYADYLGALQSCRTENPSDQRWLTISSFLINYPFASRVFPGALDVVATLGASGTTVILSDGDVVF